MNPNRHDAGRPPSEVRRPTGAPAFAAPAASREPHSPCSRTRASDDQGAPRDDQPRVLSDAEAAVTWTALASAWDITDASWWFPLAETSRRGVVAFQAAAFHAALGPTWLRRLLAERGVERTICFPEFDELPVEEVPLPVATFRFDGAERYWCDARADHRDWLVYASHEDSLTLGGGWLVAAAQRAWPAWSRQLWAGLPDCHRPETS